MITGRAPALLDKSVTDFRPKKKPENGSAKPEAPGPSSVGRLPVSFNPIVRVEWPSADKLYVQTAYVRMFPNEPVNNFPRWHLVVLSPQAALLGK